MWTKSQNLTQKKGCALTWVITVRCGQLCAGERQKDGNTPNGSDDSNRIRNQAEVCNNMMQEREQNFVHIILCCTVELRSPDLHKSRPCSLYLFDRHSFSDSSKLVSEESLRMSCNLLGLSPLMPWQEKNLCLTNCLLCPWRLFCQTAALPW